jgi:hypothetical protein
MRQNDGRKRMRKILFGAATVAASMLVSSVAWADATGEVMQADRDFARLAQEKGVAEAFAPTLRRTRIGSFPVRNRCAGRRRSRRV